MIGKTLSHYKILDEISRGGMGIVYRAVDVKLNREVALRVQGDTEKTRDDYRRFYEFWKDGEIDRERVEEVRRKL